ncbi:MAG: hypothetical protein GWN99_18020 [Gemmatimonadetes bacterium]|uniref:Uncharacterized protein n=1 Tax=Candidatus Kutchimonas denitrificans TaxID=3056748 RepID=A0AAE5CBB8_9BACT|nr:hypothetical protein [Gemmatimonadota bacterium]NIR75632.1 hypothetical protein [Candidatus Kutchimonas denitrificans]NIS02933.1 hypothetical protein [Gemmatimonadota bacterium]NIT68655.1 hypothetical protein [Gemmatimonadota bacterium]NIV25334.1 hypothetical protein [Gemmatimonadota bacterium]
MLLATAALPVGLGACSEVEIMDTAVVVADAPAEFRAIASLRWHAGDSLARWEIGAYVAPGWNDEVPRQAGDTLWIGGQPLAASPIDETGQRNYRTTIYTEPQTAHERPITIVPPDVEDMAATPVTIIGVGWMAADTVRWAPATDLSISLELPPEGPEPEPSSVNWSFRVSRAYMSISISDEGLPPSNLTIPASLLPDSGEPLRAALSLRMYRYEDPTGISDYVTGYTVAVQLEWPVRICEPGAC